MLRSLVARNNTMTRLGIQVSSVREYLQTPEDVLESFKKVSEIGYKIIQIQWISPQVPMEFIKDALEEEHLDCIGTQDYTDQVLTNLDDVIKMNELWGGSYICVSGIPERYHSSEGCIAFAAELREVAKRLKDIGKILTFHPRSQEYARYGDKIALDILLDNVVDNFQIVLDIYHVHKAGCDPVEWIHKLKGRMDSVHFKDKIILADKTEQLTPVGQGVLPWEAIFQACKDAGVRYAFAEQETWQKDPFECLKESYEYITAHGIR